MGTTALRLPSPSPPTEGGEGGGGGAAPAQQHQQEQQQNTGAGGGKATGKATQQQQEQQQEAAWYSTLPDDLKGDKAIQRHPTLEGAIRALKGAEARMGVPADQLIRKPTTPEEVGEVYRQLGAPEKPEGYQITLPDGATDADKAMASAFAAHMHEKGPFPNDAVAAAVAFWNGQTAAAAEAAQADMQLRADQGEAALRKAWGADYDDMNKEVGLLLLDAKIGGGKDLVAELEATSLGDKVQLLKFLGKIAEGRREPGSPEGEGRGAVRGEVMTPAAAKAALNALTADPVKGVALRDRAHPMHKAVLEERNKYAAWSEGKEYVAQTA